MVLLISKQLTEFSGLAFSLTLKKPLVDQLASAKLGLPILRLHQQVCVSPTNPQLEGDKDE